MSSAYQFKRPLAYLQVKAPGLDLFRHYVPLGLTVASVALYWALPRHINVVGDKSASELMAALFVTLPGFYIAALAAVATFQGGDLDGEMPGATVPMLINDAVEDVPISMRVFLCYLFSFLTVASFFGYLVCISSTLLTPSVVVLIAKVPGKALAVVFGGCATLALATIAYVGAVVISCTLQGLYFLAERVHQKLF